MDIIKSSKNPKIKLVRALRRRKERNRRNLFVVEGIRHVGEGLAAGAEAIFLIYAADRLASEFGRELIEEANQRHIPCYATTEALFASLAEKTDPYGILGVFRQEWSELGELNPETFPWGVALVQPQDPGNLGAILRSIDAVEASGLLLLDGGVDPYHPTAVRASMGATFWHPLVQCTSGAFFEWVRTHRYRIYGTSAGGDTDFRSIGDYTSPLILLMGAERRGLSDDHQARCDHLLRVPMHGRVTSLNLAVATGVILYAMSANLGGSSGR